MLFHNHLLFFKGTWFHVCTYTGTDNTHLYSISDLWERERDRKSENLKISYKAIGFSKSESLIFYYKPNKSTRIKSKIICLLPHLILNYKETDKLKAKSNRTYIQKTCRLPQSLHSKSQVENHGNRKQQMPFNA